MVRDMLLTIRDKGFSRNTRRRRFGPPRGPARAMVFTKAKTVVDTRLLYSSGGHYYRRAASIQSKPRIPAAGVLVRLRSHTLCGVRSRHHYGACDSAPTITSSQHPPAGNLLCAPHGFFLLPLALCRPGLQPAFPGIPPDPD